MYNLQKSSDNLQRLFADFHQLSHLTAWMICAKLIETTKRKGIFMRNELTKKDIELMQQELDHRRLVLRPQLIEAVKEARAFGDLSENFEYKAAKKEKNHNGKDTNQTVALRWLY